MTEHAVVIAGGGPTGLMLAGELALAGADVAIVERRTTHELDGSRAAGMTSRTLEVLDQRGILDRFTPQGFSAPVAHFSALLLDMTDQPTRHTFGLALLQYRIERTLSEWVGEHGVPIYRGREVTGFTSSDDAVRVELSDGSTLRAQYLVGCDGGRSLTRKIAGIDFPGWDPSTSCLVADVQMTEEPEWGIHRQARCIPSSNSRKTARSGSWSPRRNSAEGRSRHCAISARHYYPRAALTTEYTVPHGFPDSPT